MSKYCNHRGQIKNRQGEYDSSADYLANEDFTLRKLFAKQANAECLFDLTSSASLQVHQVAVMSAGRKFPVNDEQNTEWYINTICFY